MQTLRPEMDTNVKVAASNYYPNNKVAQGYWQYPLNLRMQLFDSKSIDSNGEDLNLDYPRPPAELDVGLFLVGRAYGLN